MKFTDGSGSKGLLIIQFTVNLILKGENFTTQQFKAPPSSALLTGPADCFSNVNATS